MAKNEDVDVITGWWILSGVEIGESELLQSLTSTQVIG